MRKGFTLIELLVVIAIIAILAAILFPVFMRAKTTANMSKCCSHGREIGIAMQMYMDDNGGRYPSDANAQMMARFSHITWRYHWPPYPADWSDVWGVGSGNAFRYIQLAPYIKNQQIWICPSPDSMYAMKYAYGARCSWYFCAGWQKAPSKYLPYPDAGFQAPAVVDGKTRMIGRTIADVLAEDLGENKRALTPARKIFAECFALGDYVKIEAYGGGPVVNPYGSYPHDEGTIYVYCDMHARYRETGHGWMPVRYTNSILDEPHRRMK